LLAIKIASLILRPDRRLVDVTSFHSVRRPSFSFGSSSFISRRRHCRSVSFRRLRPPGNIQSLSRRRLTRRTRPFFEATNFDDFAISENAPRRVHGERRFFRSAIKETHRGSSPWGSVISRTMEDGPSIPLPNSFAITRAEGLQRSASQDQRAKAMATPATMAIKYCETAKVARKQTSPML
jgi:hypothetical protein